VAQPLQGPLMMLGWFLLPDILSTLTVFITYFCLYKYFLKR